MARLEAVAKALYYPTPQRVLDLIAENVILQTSGVGTSNGALLDPCSGEGTAAAFLGAKWDMATYGIELHLERAEKSKQALTRAYQGTYLQYPLSGPMFNVLFLNPPYDIGLSGQRQETEFLMGTTPFLHHGGLLVCIIPEKMLKDEEFKTFLFRNYGGIQVFRFPEEEYQAFQQVVLFASRRSHSYNSYLDKVKEEFHNVYYSIPNNWSHPKIWEAITQDPYDLAPSITGKGVFDSPKWKILMDLSAGTIDTPPLLDPRAGHVAMLLASGALNGCELTPGNLLKGTSEKIVISSSDLDAGTITESERIVSRIAELNLGTGEFTSWRTDGDPERTKTWFETYGSLLGDAVRKSKVPQFEEKDLAQFDFSRITAPGVLPGRDVAELLPRQKLAAGAIVHNWRQRKAAILSGEMGTGKTSISITAAVLAKHKKVVVICPTHLVEKWIREVNKMVGYRKAVTAKSITQVDEFFASNRAQFLILSKEMAKLGAKWGPVYKIRSKQENVTTYERDYHYHEVATTSKVTTHKVHCPNCNELLHQGWDISEYLKLLDQTKTNCKKCASPLWTAKALSAKGTKRWPLGQYINHRYARRYSLIIDEAHQHANAETAQSRASQMLCSGATKFVLLTGTLYKGYASSIFHLLYKCDPNFRALYKYNECSRFVAHHGLYETKFEAKDETSVYGYRKGNTGGRIKEIPGIDPGMISLLLGYTVFVRLEDLGYALPAYSERVELVDHDPKILMSCQDLAGEVKRFIREYPKILGQYLMACLGYPDCPEHAEEIYIKEGWYGSSKEVLASAPAFPEGPNPKDEALALLMTKEKAEGRQGLVFFSQTNKRSPIPRVKAHLESHGLKVVVLSSSVSPVKREAWVRDEVAKGFDVMLTNGRLVETGLDLLFATTIVQYGTEYSNPVLRQSIRRSWRLGQSKEVRVVFLAYKGTMQETAMQLIAKKMRAAETLDGDAMGGLSQHDENGGNFFLELAREVVG